MTHAYADGTETALEQRMLRRSSTPDFLESPMSGDAFFLKCGALSSWSSLRPGPGSLVLKAVAPSP